MGHWELPEIKRCCFCIPLRYGLIVWGYVTLMINFIFLCDKMATVHKLLNKDEHNYTLLGKSGELMMMIADMVFVIVLIVAVYMKNVKWLKVSLIGNLTLVIVYTLYTIFMVSSISKVLHFLHQLSLDTTLIKRLTRLLVLQSAGACIEIVMKLYIMFLLRKQIKKLKTNRSQCTVNVKHDVEMENGMFKQIKIEDEEKGEDIQTVEKGDGIEVTCETEKCDYSLNNVSEIKCRIEYEGGN